MRKFDITFENGDVVAESIPFALHSGNIVSALKEQSGADRVARSFEAPDGTQVYVLDYEFVRRIHIIPPTTVSEEFFEQRVKDLDYDEIGVADYVSGAVTGYRIDTEELFLPGDDPDEDPPERQVIVNLRVTERTQERIPFNTARHKLAVQEHPTFTPILGNDVNIYSQHRVIKPGFYTGAMRPLIQVLLGVGRVKRQTYEERWVKANNKALLTGEDLGSGNEDMRSAFGLFEDANKEEDDRFKLQITYDYRWNRTHGISWGADGKAYLVEIGARGVLVRQLPVDPISTTTKGRERYEALYPELFDATWMEGYGGSFFDKFGGFPTGEGMVPRDGNLEDYVRAGEIVRALDASEMSEVYSKSTYSTAMGWAFHPNGREAHNTCYGYAENGVNEGYHYAVTIDIAAVEDRPPEEGASAVIAQLGLSGVDARKALRMTSAQAQEILRIEDGEAAREAFDALTVTPDVQVNARLRVIKKGFLYGRPNIKFAEPILPNSPLITPDFRVDDLAQDKVPRCDTPVFVCYENTKLSVVNFSWRYQQPSDSHTTFNTRQPCQFTGSWTEGYNNGSLRDCGNFYTNDVDWRQQIYTDGSYLKTTTGTFAGKLPAMTFCAFLARHSISRWLHYHSYGSTWRRSDSSSADVSVVIPANDRSIYLIAKLENSIGVVEGESQSGAEFSGAGSGRAHGVVYHPFWHWTGVCKPTLEDEGDVTCELREYGRPYQVESCFEDAISVGDTPYSACGDSFGGVSFIYGSIPSGGGFSRQSEATREFSCEIRLYGDTHISGKVTMKEFKSGKDPGGAGGLVDFYSLGMSMWWWKPSPDKDGNMAYMRVNTNRFGAPLIVYEPDIDALNPVTDGNPDEMHLGLNACYIGWVA